MSMRPLALWFLGTPAVLLVACGGGVVFDGGSSGGGGSGGTGSTTGTSSTSSTTTGGGCSDQQSCPPNSICLLGSGQCVEACSSDGFTPCPQGLVCDPCASSSCPTCDDCLAACMPAKDGACDDHDDCAMGSVCIYGAGVCAPSCNDIGGCADPNLVCDPCATSSCPGCENCLGACTMSF